ncbi:unnamed protein product [Miscanthus lutarioriparius]|uniref:Uncharacterized protein n=1 Tax=Miscanthus lutarioriparius TaxID=422564 RepID=A0A811QFB8_9POAL|nr:unnamed protein product [Miscanthus lutarioriparius]
MPLPAFLAAAARLAVLVAAAVTAANAASFARYRRRHLRHIPNPIDESADPIADFRALPSNSAAAPAAEEAAEDGNFFFGLATALAHVEDRLEDAWLQFAVEHSCDDKEAMCDHKTADAVMASAAGDGGAQLASRSRGDEKAGDGEKRKPLKVAMEAMLRGFEMFVEGGESGSGDNCSHNVAAWHNVPCPQERLKFWSDPDTELKLAKETGISVFRLGIDWTRVMPKEPTEELKSSFWLCRLVVDRVSDLVDYWVVFNEPHVFVMLTYCAGAWPGGDPNAIEVATSALPTGVYNQALHWMAIAHAEAYDYIHSESALKKNIHSESICDKLDFIGINYYGQFNERYKSLNIPFIITENGVSDETDLIRKPYILEHLLAIYAAIIMGVPVLGYLFWTMSDNWEWADGYGPKFGLVAVGRANNLARKPRPSYYLFSKVVRTGKITRQDRLGAWRELQQAAFQKKTRPFFRAVDKHGRMYAGGLDRPIQRSFILRDWRFGHYEMEGLQDPFSHFIRSIFSPILRKKKIHYIEYEDISYAISP